MEIIHEWENGPELLIRKDVNVADAKKEIEWMLPVLEKPEETGGATDDNGNLKKENRGIFLDKIYTQLYSTCSPISNIMAETIEEMSKREFTPNSVFQSLYSLGGFNCLLSAYKNNDYYKPHRDVARLTVLLWIGEKNFTGGDLYFPDFNYTIPYEQGLMIAFPSHYQHEVTQISTNEKGYVRYCASAFLN